MSSPHRPAKKRLGASRREGEVRVLASDGANRHRMRLGIGNPVTRWRLEAWPRYLLSE